jgi:hypothetical protein
MQGTTATALTLWALALSTGCGPGSAVDRAQVRGGRDAGPAAESAPPPGVADAAPGMAPGSPPGETGDAGPPADRPAPARPDSAPAAATPDAPPAPQPDAGVPRPPDAAPAADMAAPGSSAALPLVVSDHFKAQGWFGDPTLGAVFGPGSMVIRQVSSDQGLCAARVPGARGRCFEVTYTPPEGLVPPAGGGWVGAYFLPRLERDHPEAVPPLRAGEANWGVEPGLVVMTGARRVSFQAAAAAPGLAVSFRVGSERDSFLLPEATETLGTGWVRLTLPLAGARYGRVIGAFAWLLKDTSQPARFFLDDVVWEP